MLPYSSHASEQKRYILELFHSEDATANSDVPDSQFLPAQRYASAGLCDSDVSVRPSAARRYCA